MHGYSNDPYAVNVINNCDDLIRTTASIRICTRSPAWNDAVNGHYSIHTMEIHRFAAWKIRYSRLRDKTELVFQISISRRSDAPRGKPLNRVSSFLFRR
jgi:hypothetical protein